MLKILLRFCNTYNAKVFEIKNTIERIGCLYLKIDAGRRFLIWKNGFIQLLHTWE